MGETTNRICKKRERGEKRARERREIERLRERGREREGERERAGLSLPGKHCSAVTVTNTAEDARRIPFPSEGERHSPQPASPQP